MTMRYSTLKLLLCFSKEKGCTYLQLFGDSMIIVNWINKAQNCHTMFLLTLIEDVHYIVDNFDLCTCCHVHKEINSIVYKLSKEEDCRSLKWDIFWILSSTFHQRDNSLTEPTNVIILYEWLQTYWFYNTICKGLYIFCQNLHEYICFETYMNRFFGKRIIIFVTYCLNMPFFVNTFQLKDKKYMVDMYDV